MIPVVIPAKPLDVALQRLGGVLNRDERRALQAAMLADVLSAATTFSRRVVVVTADAVVAALARTHGALVAPDSTPLAGINAAVVRGIIAAGGRSVMIVMGDLPCATVADLRQVATSDPGGPGVVCAVSRDGTGTNAMVLSPVDVIAPTFGENSLARHVAAAEAAAVESTLVTAPGLMLDVDTPEDLGALVRHPGATSAGELCRALGVADRIAAAANQ
jgi:2-phospho-L-lactate/phosphoenolpyruvate guanylyltransferase